MARIGYTLPVFAVAAAKSALIHLLENNAPDEINLNLLPELVNIPIEQVAKIDHNTALGITRSDPGDNLDLTRNTPIWAWINLGEKQAENLILLGGEGIGHNSEGLAAIYNYAQMLFRENLSSLIPIDRTLTVKIILPEGRKLASRTSNAAFGVFEGLSLLGTSGFSVPHTATEHLASLKEKLNLTLKDHQDLVFCIGSNGLQVAAKMGINDGKIVQTGNWLGAMLVEAGLEGAKSIILLGYQGKLIKLAGGIFNTSSHIADGKLEIIGAAIAQCGGNLELIKRILNCQTAEGAYQELVKENMAQKVFNYLAQRISDRSQKYVQKYANVNLAINTILFDRSGQIISQ